MKLQEFDIDLNRHSEDHFQLNFKLEDSFFSLKEHSLFERCSVDTDLDFNRIDSTITMKGTMKGSLGCECERCLKSIDVTVDNSFVEVFKLTSDPELLAEDNYISETHPVIEIYDVLYEQMCIHLPSRLICENAIENNDCVLPENETKEKEIDPRWEELKKLIDK